MLSLPKEMLFFHIIYFMKVQTNFKLQRETTSAIFNIFLGIF